MNLRDLTKKKKFFLVVPLATLGGALWEMTGLPLGWLMGAAAVTGGLAMANIRIQMLQPVYAASLATLGASVGLAITPEVATAMVAWAPVMVAAAILGTAMAAMLAPILARAGNTKKSTAFFSLLPGGVIEMANVGQKYGADQTVVAAIHTMRVGLVVGVLPLILFMFNDEPQQIIEKTPLLDYKSLSATLLVGIAGGWVGKKTGLPAAWLLGALIAVGVVTSTGALTGRIPEVLLAAVQVVVGIALGARFQRERLAAAPKALAVGLPIVLAIMAGMAIAAAACSMFMPFEIPTLILCFSIGGMAEMVLTSKILGQNFALVAAFQAIRGVLINTLAGAVWRRFGHQPRNHPNTPKG